MRQLVNILIVIIIVSTCSCSKDNDDAVCAEVNFEGSWTVFSLLTIENLKTHEVTEFNNEFDITFLNNQKGYFNNDPTSDFIWGTQCEPSLLLISSIIHAQDSTGIDFYSTEIYHMQNTASNAGSIELSNQEYTTSASEVIRKTIEWTMTK